MGSIQPDSLRRRFTPYDLPLFFFLISAATGLIWLYDVRLSWLSFLTLCLGCLFYMILSRLGVREHIWSGAALGLASLSLLAALYYLLQYGYLEQTGKVAAFTQIGVLLTRFIPNLAIWKPLANSMATFLEGGLFLTLGLAWTARRTFWRWAGYLGAAVIGLAILFSASRGAWVAVLAAGLLWAALYWRVVRSIGLGLLGLLTVLGGLVLVSGNLNLLEKVPVIGEALGTLFIRPDRLTVYTNSLDLLRAYPWTGIGLGGTFGMIYSRYALLLFVPFLYYSHNLFLETWLQQGLLGLGTMIWLVMAIFTSARVYRQANPDIRFQSTWIGLSAILIHGLSDARQYESLWCWLPFFGLLALNAAILLQRSPMVTGRVVWLLPPAITVVSVLCIVLWLGSVPANSKVNQGALLQTRADLQPGLTDVLRQQKREQAEDLFQQALQIDPANWPARYRLGLLQLQREDFSRAMENLEAARRGAPYNYGVQKALGLAYTWNGDVDQAVQLLRNMPGIISELDYWEWYFRDKNQMQLAAYTHKLLQRLQTQQ